MDINAVIDALREVLAPITPHRLAYLPSNVSQVPVVCVILDPLAATPIDYGRTFGQDTHLLRIDVFLIVGKNDEESAYRRLNTFLSFPGAQSIMALLEADQTLGGLTTSVEVEDPVSIGTQLIGQGTFLGIHIPVQAMVNT